MKINKVALCVIAGLVLGTAAFAQEKEKTVESEYMSSMEDIIITELANADERENKEIALQMLGEAIDKGNISPDMMLALEHLAGEGTNTQSRTKGRVMNNMPDIRREACLLLGKVPTKDSATKLNKIIKTDNEPMVMSAAIHSLGEIGINDNDEASNTISYYADRIGHLNPAGNSSLALEVVNAFDKLSGNIKDTKPVINTLQQIIANQQYVKPVRDRAKEVLSKMRSVDNSNDNKKK